MSRTINLVILGTVLFGASATGNAQQLEAKPEKKAERVTSSVITAACLDPASQQLGVLAMNDYWDEARQPYEDLNEIETQAKRGWAQRNIVDRTSLEISYGTNYKLKPGDDITIDTTSEGTSWGITYELPFSAFGSGAQLGAPERKAKVARDMAIAEAKAKFMSLLFDFKVGVAKHDEDPGKGSVLYAAERLAAQIASASPGFESACMKQSIR